jgi:hypothetical protein
MARPLRRKRICLHALGLPLRIEFLTCRSEEQFNHQRGPHCPGGFACSFVFAHGTDGSASEREPHFTSGKWRYPSGISQARRKEYASGGFQIDAHAATQRRRDVDQCIEREARDLAAYQIVDPRLRYAATGCRFGLRPAVPFQARCDLLHQLGPCSQIRSLLGGVRDSRNRV